MTNQKSAAVVQLESEWTREDQAAASDEGWNIFVTATDDGEDIQVQKNDEEEILATDDDAHMLIALLAEQGSALHIKALNLVSDKERALILNWSA